MSTLSTSFDCHVVMHKNTYMYTYTFAHTCESVDTHMINRHQLTAMLVTVPNLIGLALILLLLHSASESCSQSVQLH